LISLKKLKKKKLINTLPHLEKNRLHAFQSLTDDYVSKKLGESADAVAFDFNNPILAPLGEFF
jgi:hypothetical protein